MTNMITVNIIIPTPAQITQGSIGSCWGLWLILLVLFIKKGTLKSSSYYNIIWFLYQPIDGAVKATCVVFADAKSKGKFAYPISLPFLWSRLYHQPILLGCRTLMVYYIGRSLNHLVVEPSSKVRLRLGCWLPFYFGGVPAIHPIYIYQLLDRATTF